MAPQAPNDPFPTVVNAELRIQRIGVRTLARRMAGEGASPDAIESDRRSLRRWLSGKTTPSARSREKVADALGISPSELDPPEDDSSASLTREIRMVRDELRALRADMVRS